MYAAPQGGYKHFALHPVAKKGSPIVVPYQSHIRVIVVSSLIRDGTYTCYKYVGSSLTFTYYCRLSLFHTPKS